MSVVSPMIAVDSAEAHTFVRSAVYALQDGFPPEEVFVIDWPEV